jgi:hypothetical protein
MEIITIDPREAAGVHGCYIITQPLVATTLPEFSLLSC